MEKLETREGERATNKFPSPNELRAPDGAEGWRDMYPRFYLFSKELGEYEESKFWFLDNIHNPFPVPPFDIIWLEAWQLGLNQMTTRILMIPQAKGIDHRIQNGYFYVSPTVADWSDNVVDKRAKEFKARSSYYYQNWERLYSIWYENMQRVINDAKNLEVRLPDYVDISLDYLSNKSLSPAHILHVNFRHLIDLAFEAEAQRHFEFANLAYASLLAFMDFMKEKFPEIKDSTIVKMVQGIDTLMLRPDEELRKLAKLACELGLAERFASASSWDNLTEKLKKDEPGRSWLQSCSNAEYPWFYVHSGPTPNREYFYFKSWMEDHSFPLLTLKTYVSKLEKKENIDRDLPGLLAERERIRQEYRDLLPERDVEAYDSLLKLSESTYRYAEDHVFIVSNWFRTVFYLKINEFAKLLADAGFISEVDDLYYFHYLEVDEMLKALEISWATMNPSATKHDWMQTARKRKAILEHLKVAKPPPALGVPPKVVTDPYMIMLWGITGDKIKEWLRAFETSGSQEGRGTKMLGGFPASSGKIEGVARVILDTDGLRELREGEILVCPITSPNWGPFLPKVRAIVTDNGGIMSHAAIIAREYSVPAVVGTGFATRLIKTGEKISVDGTDGKVYILG